MMLPTPRAGAADEDGEPVCNLAAALHPRQHAYQCEWPDPRPPGASSDPSLATTPVFTVPFPQAGELETLKQSSRLVHYCATALLFDPAAWLHGPPETCGPPEGQVRLKTPGFLPWDLLLQRPPFLHPWWLTVGRAFLNFHSRSGAIALRQGLGAERPPRAVRPWMCPRQVLVRSLG